MDTIPRTSGPRRRGRAFLLLERVVLSVAMTVAAFVTERLLLRAIGRDA